MKREKGGQTYYRQRGPVPDACLQPIRGVDRAREGTGWRLAKQTPYGALEPLLFGQSQADRQHKRKNPTAL